MVHTYLMYGFPSETARETVDSLEVVRQMFERGLIQSGFWHRFAMTAHSPVGQAPGLFGTRVTEPPFGGFARNDVAFEDLEGGDHERLGDGLSRSLYNYMRGVGFDLPLQKWFDFKIPVSSVSPRFVEQQMEASESVENLYPRRLYWIGGEVEFGAEIVKKGKIVLTLHDTTRDIHLKIKKETAVFLHDIFSRISADVGEPYLLKDFYLDYETAIHEDFLPFWYGKEMQVLREYGLLLL